MSFLSNLKKNSDRAIDNNVDLLEVIAGEDGGTSGLGRFETVTGCLTTVDNLAASWTCAYHFLMSVLLYKVFAEQFLT